MIKVIVSGACGKMGNAVAKVIGRQKDMQVLAGYDIVTLKEEFPVYDDLGELPGNPDIIIDFSNPSALENLIDFAISKNAGLAVGTTGLTNRHKTMLKDASKLIPVFVAHNMCLGISLILDLAKHSAKTLQDYDIEIIDKHHNHKIDAPSGTALMIADAVKEVRQESNYVYSRADKREERSKNEIGIHSIRGGNLVGEHTVLFIGEDETIEITHSIMSREVFAKGALNVIRFIKEQNPGYYTMSDMIR